MSHLSELNANTGAVLWHTLLTTGTGPDGVPNSFIWSSPAVYPATSSDPSVYTGLATPGESNAPRRSTVQGLLYQVGGSTDTIQHVFNVVANSCTGSVVWGSPTIDVQAGIVSIATDNPGSCSAPPGWD